MFPMKRRFPTWLKVLAGLILIINLLAMVSSFLALNDPSKVNATLDMLRQQGLDLPPVDPQVLKASFMVTLVGTIITAVSMILLIMNRGLGFYLYTLVALLNIVTSLMAGDWVSAVVGLGLLALIAYGVKASGNELKETIEPRTQKEVTGDLDPENYRHNNHNPVTSEIPVGMEDKVNVYKPSGDTLEKVDEIREDHQKL